MNTQASGLITNITIHSPSSLSSSSLAASSAQNAANAMRSVGLRLASPQGDEFFLGCKPLIHRLGRLEFKHQHAFRKNVDTPHLLICKVGSKHLPFEATLDGKVKYSAFPPSSSRCTHIASRPLSNLAIQRYHRQKL